MNPLARAAGVGLYHAMRLVLGSAARSYYPEIDVRHPERIPRSGPLLIVANHPASLTDVLVLGAVIPRRLHFVAYSGLFQPGLLGFVLRLVGAVPVYRREDNAEHMHRNAEMFRACNQVFEEGGAVLIFPEGTSASDRKVERIKTGSARMAIAYAGGPGPRPTLVLLPMGLHFSDRTTFRSRVALSVGRPIDLAEWVRAGEEDPAQAVRGLTERIQFALEKLILNVPSANIARLVHDVERVYLDHLHEVLPDAPQIALARSVADSIEHFRRSDPERVYDIWHDVATYQRKLAALNLRDPVLRDPLTRRAGFARSARLGALALLGGVPAMAGAVVHYLPYQLSGVVGGWFGRDPTRIAFSRIMCGVVLFPLAAAGWALMGIRFLHGEPRTIALGLLAAIPLGFFSLWYFRWLRRERHRLRALMLVTGNRRLLARLRAERRRIIAQLDAARADYIAYLAATGGTPAQTP